MTLDNHNGVITHLEPGILESKDKWALGSITINKPRGDDVIPAELFQILKDDAVKMLHSNLAANLENSTVVTGLEKVIPLPKKTRAEECSNYHTIALVSYASKIMLKIHQVRLQQCVNQEHPDHKLYLKKRGGRDKQKSLDHRKIKGISRIISTSASLTTLNPLPV